MWHAIGGPYLAGEDGGPADQSHLDLPAARVDEVLGASHGCQVQQFAALLPPAHRPLSGQILPGITYTTVISVISGEGWDSDITVKVIEGAVLLPPPQVQHGSDLASGQGGSERGFYDTGLSGHQPT